MNSNLVKANYQYRRSQDNNGLCKMLREDCLRKALTIYYGEVKNTADDNLPALMWNIGMSNLKLAELMDSSTHQKLILYHLGEAIKSFCSALVNKNEALDSEWSSRVQERISLSIDLAFRSVAGDVKLHRVPKLPLLQALFLTIGSQKLLDPIRVLFLISRGQYFLRCGITAMEEGDFKTTLQLLEYGHEDTDLALIFNHGDEINLDEITRLAEDHAFLRCSCESIKMRAQADELFNSVVNQSEELNFDMMWEILDMYKEAALKTREKDIENEAAAISRQGRIFDKIFKLRSKAHLYYRQAFDLAQCLLPRDLNKVDWFLESKRALDRFQQEIREEEDEKYQKLRAPIVEKLAPILNELNAVHNKHDTYKFLAYIYSKHPPKTEAQYQYDEKKVTAKNVKKTLMNAIFHYHPDKQIAFDIEWKVLCEELTKCLNVRYCNLKGCN